MNDSSSISLSAGFAPVVDRNTRILILGSFPGVASLAAQQYYAHPRNQFWRLLAAVFQDDGLTALPYPARLNRLTAHGVGLWDVLAGCTRAGSLDSAIRDGLANDFNSLRLRCPALETIGFNGKAAGKFAPYFQQLGLRTIELPSSSPAYATFSLAQKLAAWRQLRS